MVFSDAVDEENRSSGAFVPVGEREAAGEGDALKLGGHGPSLQRSEFEFKRARRSGPAPTGAASSRRYGVIEMADLDFLACEPTPIGLICLRQRPVPGESGALVTEITLDNQFLMSSENTESERALSSLALAMHAGTGLRVLVGGLGLGYTAIEALRSERVAHVEVVELLAPVIDWVARGLVPLSNELNGDARLTVTEGDVYLRLSQPPQSQHDLILIDVDHSPDERLGPSNASFYTAEGLELAKRYLAPGGVLAVWSYAESSPFADALRQVFREVRVETSSFENRVVSGEETNWLFLAKD